MECPHCRGSGRIVKIGLRRTKKGSVQKYRCMECGRSFSDSMNPHSSYPMKIILHTLELYNMGYPASSVKRMIGKNYHRSPPINTIYSWIGRYEDDLTFIKLRKKMDLDPERILYRKNFIHRQVHPFAYHDPKLNIHSKTFPGIKRYVNWIDRSLPDKIFLEGPRMSNYSIDAAYDIKPIKNNLPRLTELALERSSDPSPHNSVESFFLINDSSTVATEVPVFLNPDEFDGSEIPITGHIDILQARFGRIYVLDYKPNLNRPEEYSSQLYLYREAVHRRMNIPVEKISAIAFNEHEAVEYLYVLKT